MFDDVTTNDKKGEKYESVCKETYSVYVLILRREQVKVSPVVSSVRKANVCQNYNMTCCLCMWDEYREKTELHVLLDNGNEEKIVFGHVEKHR